MGKGMFADKVKSKSEDKTSPSIIPNRDPLEKHQYAISDDLMFEVCSLVHRRWSIAFDALKAVMNERNDGSTDWKMLHEERLNRAVEDERAWKRRQDEAAEIFGSIIRAE